jgi:hypothetical protein
VIWRHAAWKSRVAQPYIIPAFLYVFSQDI